MKIFDNVKSAICTNSHGEVNFFLVTEGTIDLSGFKEVKPEEDGHFVVGHSESGHNHVLEADGVLLMERELDGMKVLRALLTKPVALKQLAGTPHQVQIVKPGEYFVTNNVEYDPFLEQALRVSD